MLYYDMCALRRNAYSGLVRYVPCSFVFLMLMVLISQGRFVYATNASLRKTKIMVESGASNADNGPATAVRRAAVLLSMVNMYNINI